MSAGQELKLAEEEGLKMLKGITLPLYITVGESSEHALVANVEFPVVDGKLDLLQALPDVFHAIAEEVAAQAALPDAERPRADLPKCSGGPLEAIAYQAYGDAVEWKNYAGLPMPTWQDLPEGTRRAWAAAAGAVAVEVAILRPSAPRAADARNVVSVSGCAGPCDASAPIGPGTLPNGAPGDYEQ